MRKKKEENVQNKSISEDTKGEIQELFDELFINRLISSVNQVDAKISDSTDEINNLKVQENKHHLVISDLIERMSNTINCLGDADDWDNDTLLSAINYIIDNIDKQAEGVLLQTSCLKGDWGDENLIKRISDISQSLSSLDILVNSFSQKYETNSVADSTKIFNQLRQIDGIIGKLSNVEAEIEEVEKSADAERREKEILEKQEQLLFALTSCTDSCFDIQQKCCELYNALLRNENVVLSFVNDKEGELLEKVESLQRESNLCVTASQEKIQELINKKVIMIYLAIGIIGILNIATIVLVLLK